MTLAERATPMVKMLAEEASLPFEAWLRLGTRTGY